MNGTLDITSLNAFKVKIDNYRVKIDNAIFTELNQRKSSSFYKPLMKALKVGKRLRPIMLILSFESLSKRKMNPFPAAVAVELAHTESLIHDDVIDRDFLRRGTATFCASYGNEMALLSADFILSMILDITARYTDPRIAHALAFATSEMCEGELKEVLAYKNKQKLSKNGYIEIISKKTASLFEASTAIGAIIAGAEEDEIEALSDYGRLIGIAYQIQDDIKDLGKTTAINLLKFLDADSEKIKTLHALSNSYTHEAKNKLEKLRVSKAKDLLIEFADFVASPAIIRI
ncbi:polyprenyl synthetase family protein [Candidatus Bathyarchaeota archaeon]|nr:polyprenyl synthetase family protein [Candidatus Bathyarchaeota archaeon]